MRYTYAALTGLMLGVAGIAVYAAPATHTPTGTTAMPPSASTHCPPGAAGAPPDTRAPYAATGNNAMPRNPDSRTTPEQPMKPQPPSPNPPPCR